jgi:gamma-glutamyltranspeptidase
MKNTFPAWAVAVAACMPVLAVAQTAKTDAQRPVPQLRYQSAFADYKPYKDIPLAKEGDSTTHFSVVDRFGNAVSNTIQPSPGEN